MVDTRISQRQVQANGLSFACLEAGSGPLVLCLHGFPDTPHGYTGLLLALAEAGFRAVAPYARGYAPSAAPASDDFGATAQARDVIALIDALECDDAVLIGHDWGAVAAYAAANLAPDRIRRLVALSVPPLRIAKANAAWLAMVASFQVTPLASWLLRRDHGALIDRIYRLAAPKWAFTEQDTAPAKACSNAPGGASHMLGPYRALLRMMLGGRTHPDRLLQNKKLSVSALLITGSHDPAFSAGMLDDFAKACSGPSRTRLIKGSGHFPHRERPAEVHEEILGFLKASL